VTRFLICDDACVNVPDGGRRRNRTAAKSRRAESVAIVAVVAAFALSGCASKLGSPSIRIVGDDVNSVIIPNVGLEQTPTVILLSLCTTGKPIIVDTVYAATDSDGSGVMVASWGIRKHLPSGSTAVPANGPVTQMPSFANHTVSATCHSGSSTNTLAVSVRALRYPAITTGVWVDYPHHKPVLDRYRITLCRTSIKACGLTAAQQNA
jgi:hypothetical protein